jgi:Ca2+:H+ antiporter
MASLYQNVTSTASEPADPSATAEDGVEEADEEADKPKERRKRHKHRHHHHHHHHRHPRHHDPENGDGADLEQTQSAPAGDNEEERRRVEFAAASDVEAQPESSRPKPFSLRALRPPIPKHLSQNVFRDPPQADPSVPSDKSRPQDLRRSQSVPADPQHIPTFRTAPGAIPAIVPILVNATPKPKVEDEEEKPEISRTTAILLLLGSTGLVALCAEFMVDSINEVVGDGSGLSEAFVGLILLPIVGNAAEHVTAVTVAMKNKMDLAIGVALGSSIQIAIFVTPLVVILGWIMNKEMSLFFTLFETVSLFVSAFIVNFLVLDGRSNYLEGALLCSAYVIIAVAAFFYPGADSANELGGGNGSNNTTTEAVVASSKLLTRGIAYLAGLGL